MNCLLGQNSFQQQQSFLLVKRELQTFTVFNFYFLKDICSQNDIHARSFLFMNSYFSTTTGSALRTSRHLTVNWRIINRMFACNTAILRASALFLCLIFPGVTQNKQVYSLNQVRPAIKHALPQKTVKNTYLKLSNTYIQVRNFLQ